MDNDGNAYRWDGSAYLNYAFPDTEPWWKRWGGSKNLRDKIFHYNNVSNP